jgi:predicted RNA-binding Zn ribbon-like protein
MGVVFVGGNLALDYVGTLNERRTRRVEQLRAPADLGRWLVSAGVLDRPPEVTADDLAAAIGLREVLFALIEQRIDRPGEAPRPAHLRRLNAAAAAPDPVPRLAGNGRITHTGDLAAGLSAVARDAIGLFDPDREGVLKWCADDACTHPFLDRSRGHRRRWCEMAGCGDRVKAAAYRARRRGDAASSVSAG